MTIYFQNVGEYYVFHFFLLLPIYLRSFKHNLSLYVIKWIIYWYLCIFDLLTFLIYMTIYFQTKRMDDKPAWPKTFKNIIRNQTSSNLTYVIILQIIFDLTSKRLTFLIEHIARFISFFTAPKKISIFLFIRTTTLFYILYLPTFISSPQRRMTWIWVQTFFNWWTQGICKAEKPFAAAWVGSFSLFLSTSPPFVRITLSLSLSNIDLPA